VLNIKILSLGDPERYAVRRMVTAVQHELQTIDPKLQMNITEVNDAGQIGRFASVLVLPTLVINEKVVCSGRFPTREEIARWLLEAENESSPRRQERQT
jgi:Thioredoxin domain